MFALEATFTILELDSATFFRVMRVRLDQLLREAIKEFVLAATKLIPVYSGMSRGAYLVFAKHIQFSIRINPVVRSRVVEGERAASFEITSTKDTVGFTFNPGVLHYFINEHFDVSRWINLRTPGPYNSLAAGRRAYTRYVKKHIASRIPSIADHMIRTRVTIDKNGRAVFKKLVKKLSGA